MVYNDPMKLIEPQNELGKKLRTLRKQKGFTQEKLAEISGVSMRVVEHYEKYAKRPSIDKIKKISKALGVSDEELLSSENLKHIKTPKDVPFKALKKIRVIEQLPKREQDMIYNMINTLAQKHGIK